MADWTFIRLYHARKQNFYLNIKTSVVWKSLRGCYNLFTSSPYVISFIDNYDIDFSKCSVHSSLLITVCAILSMRFVVWMYHYCMMTVHCLLFSMHPLELYILNLYDIYMSLLSC